MDCNSTGLSLLKLIVD
ncbi:Protein of unknown function [Bacillus wiedmannii]|nr:Protein of unknown function [Bacillus wiedmannii]